ncbi:colicin uptake protein TolQ, partial [Salmonella enterica subsp. enterica serovar Infantis]
MNILDLF